MSYNWGLLASSPCYHAAMLSASMVRSPCFHVRCGLSKTGWWFGTSILFSHILGISSSQLTFIFFRGVAQPPTRKFGTPLHPLVDQNVAYDNGHLLLGRLSVSFIITHFQTPKSQIVRYTSIVSLYLLMIGWNNNGFSIVLSLDILISWYIRTYC